jgi:hypothetical protein
MSTPNGYLLPAASTEVADDTFTANLRIPSGLICAANSIR